MGSPLLCRQKMFNCCLVVVLAAALSACGGGGGGGTETPVTPAVAPPQVAPSPVSQVEKEGNTLTLVANATGAGVLSYQWQSSVDGVVFVDLPDAKSATYVVSPVPLDYDGRWFRVVVKNDGGSTTGSAMRLRVDAVFLPVASGPALIWTAPGTAMLQFIDSSTLGAEQLVSADIQAFLADDNRAVVRHASTANNASGNDTVARDLLVTRASDGTWVPERPFVGQAGSRLVANGSGWVTYQRNVSSSQTDFYPSATIAPGIADKLNVAPAFHTVFSGGEQTRPSTRLGSDGSQYVTWAATRYSGIAASGWALERVALSPSGTQIDSKTVYTEYSWDGQLPTLSDDEPENTGFAWRNWNHAVWWEESHSLRMGGATLDGGFALGGLATAPMVEPECMPIKSYRKGAISMAIWGERGTTAGECKLHATITDPRYSGTRVFDKVLTEPGQYVADAWASLNSAGMVMVAWRTRGSGALSYSSTVLPGFWSDPVAAEWSAATVLRNASGGIADIEKIGSGDYANTAIKAGKNGHLAVLYKGAAATDGTGAPVAARLYTPGVGWSEEKPLFKGDHAEIGEGNLSVSSSGKLLIAYSVPYYSYDERKLDLRGKRYLMAVVIE